MTCNQVKSTELGRFSTRKFNSYVFSLKEAGVQCFIGRDRLQCIPKVSRDHLETRGAQDRGLDSTELDRTSCNSLNTYDISDNIKCTLYTIPRHGPDIRPFCIRPDGISKSASSRIIEPKNIRLDQIMNKYKKYQYLNKKKSYIWILVPRLCRIFYRSDICISLSSHSRKTFNI